MARLTTTFTTGSWTRLLVLCALPVFGCDDASKKANDAKAKTTDAKTKTADAKAKAKADDAKAKVSDNKADDAKADDAKADDAKADDAKADDAKADNTKADDTKADDGVIGSCDDNQAKISHEADERATDWSIAQHLEKNFPDRKVSWLMPESIYQKYVIETKAEKFGRCNDTGCYLFAAPTAVIAGAVESAKKGDSHDPAVIGKALGLPAKNFEGPLRMMTLDLNATGSCVRLPVDADPGVWKCKSEEDTDCFKFGGYTSGNIPEVMVIDAPVDKAEIKEIP